MNVSKMISAFVVTFALGVNKGNKGQFRSPSRRIAFRAGRNYTERKGELPSGLQKKKDDGELTKGLEDGGKKLKTSKTK